MEESSFSHLMVLVVFLIFVGLKYKRIKQMIKDEIDG
ncbi:hypothetical protein SAMN05878494_5352 [Bacillus cereus]|nr:hypothetical protein SAMN05878494_5352 [Bacillus cereus]